VNFLVLTSFILVLAQLPYPQVMAETTLAETINSIVSTNTWTNDPSVISVGTIFDKVNLSAFDYATVSHPYEWAWVRQLAFQEGYTSQIIDNQVNSMMLSQIMTGSMPATFKFNNNSVFLVHDRYLIPLYDLASQWGMSSKWNKSTAISEIQSNLQLQKPLLGFNSSGGLYFASRYYDEWIEDLDIAMKLGDTSTAAMLWDGINSAPPDGTWNEQTQTYAYAGTAPNTLECEVGFFATIVGNYKATVENIPYFDRVSTDLYNKLLINGWNSPLWGEPSAMRHATTNQELRLKNTLGGIEALHMYYKVSDNTYRSAFASLLDGEIPAWKHFASSSIFSESDSYSYAMKASLLFLYGVIPDSGSLAIPTNEWSYEDTESMMPSTLFRFDFATRTIRIPVYAGKLKFCFGSSIASYTFPSNGIYQVQFSSDWNTVITANKIGGLTQFHLLGSNEQPDVAIMNVSSFKTVVGLGYSLNTSATATNQGDYPETFNVTVYANNINIETQPVTLENGTSTTAMFTLNTTGFAYGNYTVRAYAEQLPEEADTSDNYYTCGTSVHVGVPGDISGPVQGVYDGKCDMRDISYLMVRFNSELGSVKWSPNADINSDGSVNMRDVQIAILNFNKYE